MPITAAEVEANGWVLRVTLTGAPISPATDFAAYALDPDGSPRLVLTTSHGGFVKSAGTAVAGTIVRSLVGLRALRLPVNLASPTVKVIDETDLGGGSVRVRIALSEWVYATDNSLSLAVLAGWRAGEAAQAGIAVVNSSGVVAPVPIFRWVLAPYEVIGGSFRLSLIVASHHPTGFEPVAGVRFTATDGVNTKAVWATALATDDSLGDGLRCYSVVIDPGTATALIAGLLRCDAEVFPWLGAMRSTDPAGTRSMATLRTDGFRSGAEAPFVVGHDPAGTRYGGMFAFVDPVNGTTTPAAGMIAATRAAAKAIAPASRPRDVSTVVAAGRLVLRALPAANGQAAATQSVDGLVATMAAGTHVGFGATSVPVGVTCTEIPLVIEGDPDVADSRGACVLQTGASTPNLRIPRLRWRNLTVLAGGNGLASPSYNLIDNIEIRGRAGDEAVTTAAIGSNSVPSGQVNWHVTRTRIWKTGMVLGAANRLVGLLRGCQFNRRALAITMVKNRWIAPGEDGFTSDAASFAQGLGLAASATDLGMLEDVVVAYNDLRRIRYNAWAAPAASGTLAGLADTSKSSLRRHVLLNNVFERTSPAGNTSDNFFSYGETQHCRMSYIIIEGNSFAGSNYNAFYSDPVPTTVAETNSQFNEAFVIRHAGNACDRNASKHDDFSDPSVLAVRSAGGVTSPTGYRPQMIHAWGPHFGTGMEGHVDCARKGTIANFRREGSGLRGVQFAVPTAPGWTDDRSEAGSNSGGGNYVPVAGSVFLGRVRRGNSDRDFAGAARVVGGAAGAFEAAANVVVAPFGARSPQRAGAAVLAVGLRPEAAVSGQRSGATLLGWAAGLVAADAVSGMVATAAAVTPADGPAAAVTPFGARHVVPPDAVVLLPDRVAGGLPALRVTGERRVLAIL